MQESINKFIPIPKEEEGEEFVYEPYFQEIYGPPIPKEEQFKRYRIV